MAWTHVTLTDPNDTGPNPKWICNHCNSKHSGGTTRVHQHLLGGSQNIRACTAISADAKKELKELLEEDEAATGLGGDDAETQRATEPAAPVPAKVPAEQLRAAGRKAQGTLENWATVQPARDKGNEATAKMLYETGQSLLLFKHPALAEFVGAVQQADKGWKLGHAKAPRHRRHGQGTMDGRVHVRACRHGLACGITCG